MITGTGLSVRMNVEEPEPGTECAITLHQNTVVQTVREQTLKLKPAMIHKYAQVSSKLLIVILSLEGW